MNALVLGFAPSRPDALSRGVEKVASAVRGLHRVCRQEYDTEKAAFRGERDSERPC